MNPASCGVTFLGAVANIEHTVTQRRRLMNRMTAATALSSAIGLAIAMQAGPTTAAPAQMPQVVKDNMDRMARDHLEKCYGINTVAKNDCAEGAHSCAGQATKASDTKSFVLLPAGVCAKIAGGNTRSS